MVLNIQLSKAGRRILRSAVAAAVVTGAVFAGDAILSKFFPYGLWHNKRVFNVEEGIPMSGGMMYPRPPRLEDKEARIAWEQEIAYLSRKEFPEWHKKVVRLMEQRMFLSIIGQCVERQINNNVLSPPATHLVHNNDANRTTDNGDGELRIHDCVRKYAVALKMRKTWMETIESHDDDSLLMVYMNAVVQQQTRRHTAIKGSGNATAGPRVRAPFLERMGMSPDGEAATSTESASQDLSSNMRLAESEHPEVKRTVALSQEAWQMMLEDHMMIEYMKNKEE